MLVRRWAKDNAGSKRPAWVEGRFCEIHEHNARFGCAIPRRRAAPTSQSVIEHLYQFIGLTISFFVLILSQA